MDSEATMRRRKVGQTSRKRNPIRRRNLDEGSPFEEEDEEREVEIGGGIFDKADDAAK